MEKKPMSICRLLFFISLGYYVIWLLYALYCAVFGIDSGWLIPSLSNHEKNYGMEGFSDGLGVAMITTVYRFWFIPLYQIIYLITAGIRRLKNKLRDKGKKA